MLPDSTSKRSVIPNESDFRQARMSLSEIIPCMVRFIGRLNRLAQIITAGTSVRLNSKFRNNILV